MRRRLFAAPLLLFPLTLSAWPAAEYPAPLSPWRLRALVAQKPTGEALAELRARIVAFFGKDNLRNLKAAPKARVEDTLACWALIADTDPGQGPPRLVDLDSGRRWDLQRLGPDDNLYLLFLDLPAVTELRYTVEVNGKRLTPQTLRVEYYPRGPDSFSHDGVSRGVVTRMPRWKDSKVFPNTERDWWLYVPAQYDAKGPPACVMVFQDGEGYVNPNGAFRVPTVLDNLIQRKEVPVIIGVFINPGDLVQEKRPRGNRSIEYDTVSDAYARFLRDEILPAVAADYHITRDPAGRAICGISSGGICAWTVAWEMPDQFGKVLSHVGSFTNIRGGHVYPALIRRTPKKPIRVYLQDGARDLDNEFGNWPLANQEMASALKFKGYDYHFEYGPGFHSGNHGGAILPESLKWLWRDYQVGAE
jgi:enterochelin esterase family protein